MSATGVAKELGSHLMKPIVAEAAAIEILRRDIHAHPEPGFEEQRTADLIARKLTEWGIPVHRGLGKTGVVGIVKSGSSSRAVGLRADIDALPVTERNTFAHASVHPGKMHACGHDGHTATPCCWLPPSTYPFIAISTVPSTLFSSPPKNAAAARAR
jgi:metal-dependent amidase/aminoacylase/carboxypeptidase family protein